ncbi:MAG: PrsW family glutamic-type intramembrane protease [Candidatus Thermoplasmatota archaeon]|nr:PrsW family glutamic-type intramembrane protease [Candidatus Thermoplasmatota archaeon]
MDTAPLTPADPGLQMARPSRPWRMYGRIVALVVLTFCFVNALAGGVIVALQYDVFIGAFCIAFSIPFLLGMMMMRRPRVILLERAVPDQNGQIIHPITSHEGSLKTPMPTRMGRHLIRDDSVLDVPTSKASWILFTITVLTVIGLAIMAAIGGSVFFLIYILLAIPAILIGFSIPVMAWWSHSTWRIGLPTRKRDAEAWLMAGMFSAIPAIIINSYIFPQFVLLFSPNISLETMFILMVSVSAPVGEEICKGLAVYFFAKRIRSPKHGFQIGFTVGLGFAIVENLQYISDASIHPASLAFTTLIRGVGSIPGHAFWTSLTGVGLGWYQLNQRTLNLHQRAQSGQHIEAPMEQEKEWKIFDQRTGEEIQTVEKEITGGVQVLPSGVQVWTPIQSHQMKQNLQLIKVPLPKHPILGLILAIFGHAFWNGSSIAIGYWSESQGMGLAAQVILQLIWIVLLVTGVLLLGRGLMASIRDAPDGSNLDHYQAILHSATGHK